jgi:hypothetical protein
VTYLFHVHPSHRPCRHNTTDPKAIVNVQDVYLADLTSDEAVVGFTVQSVALRPDGPPVFVSVVAYIWGDPSHRLIKTCFREGIVYQLQAYGRRLSGNGGPEWLAERFWPGRYGPRWVLERLQEHLGRSGYRPLIELHVPAPPSELPVTCDSAVSIPAVV